MAREKQRHVVGPASEIPDEGNKVVNIGSREIVVFRANGRFYALTNRCPHEGGKLCAGKLFPRVDVSPPGEYRVSTEKRIVRCPWHAWEFDLETGQSWCDPNRVRVRPYATEVQSGRTLVEGPYRAETFEVSVEDDYVVVHV